MLSPYPWQQTQWQRLLDAAAQGRLPHALLFAGAEGMGIEDFARALAARLLCDQPGESQACGECRSCRLFAAGNHPDFIVVAPEETGKAIRVDAVREFIETVQLSSQYGRYKIAVIEPAESMNRNAANSLLKTLEEPPPQSVMILNSRRPSLLPVTIRSRCQQVAFPIRSREATRVWLAQQLDCGDDRAAEILTMAMGRPLAAVTLEEDGVVEKQAAILADLEKLKSRSAGPVDTANAWLNFDAGRVMQWLLVFIQLMVRSRLGAAAADEETGNRFRQDLERLAAGVDLHRLLKWYDIVLKNYRAAAGPYNLNQQGLLEEIIVHWQTLANASGRN